MISETKLDIEFTRNGRLEVSTSLGFSSSIQPARSTYAGLFLTTLSLLQLEFFLTRIYSVTMYYHFAFMAISLAMFGIAAGAVWIQLTGKGNPHELLSKMTLLFAISTAVCFAVQLQIPINPGKEVLNTVMAFLLISVPFVFAGMIICVGLTRFPEYTGKLYAADLAGSAAGCILTVPILNHIAAPTAVIFNASIAALAAFIFSLTAGKHIRRLSLATTAFLLVVAVLNPSLHLVDLKWVKGEQVVKDDDGYERWNAISRIWVGKPFQEPFGWGLSPSYQATHTIDQKWMNIDAGAATVISKFNGDFAPLEHLKHDVTSLAHYLRPNDSVLAIGVGGGRDILAGLLFGQKRIVGVEINRDILAVLNSLLPEYSGNLGELPQVELVQDEARSYVTRTEEKFGIIQASLIDTWASTAAGAYALSENGLYTKEAWVLFLNHLKPGGILTMSRWSWVRMASLAMAALQELGVENPREHMIVVNNRAVADEVPGVSTILVGRRPFSREEVVRVRELVDDIGFSLVFSPDYLSVPYLEGLLDPATHPDFVQSYPLDISASTDDRPFFFHTLHARDLFKYFSGQSVVQIQSVQILATLLLLVLVLCLLAVILPLAVSGQVRGNQSFPLTVFFSAIGLAFMMIEIGQLERLTLFLGHPIYGLSVVIFVLLAASSLGSYASVRLGHLCWLLPVVLVALIWIGPLVTAQFVASSTAVRISVSVLILFPAGFFMGMLLPIGMRQAQQKPGAPTAWYWAINGAFSVVASVLAVMVSIFWGITATLIIGLIGYLLAFLMLQRELSRGAPCALIND